MSLIQSEKSFQSWKEIWCSSVIEKICSLGQRRRNSITMLFVMSRVSAHSCDSLIHFVLDSPVIDRKQFLSFWTLQCAQQSRLWKLLASSQLCWLHMLRIWRLERSFAKRRMISMSSFVTFSDHKPLKRFLINGCCNDRFGTLVFATLGNFLDRRFNCWKRKCYCGYVKQDSCLD